MEEDMVRIIITIIALIILFVGFGYYIRMIKKVKRPKGAGIGMGFAIGMIICVAIGIALSELGGYHNAMPLSLVFGAAVGLWIEVFRERRHQKQ